ncbi:MAG: hypothetical protein IJB82_03160 [Bacilli bacterium]|nr:hypothetical protein [Bacilli bacterium]
MKKLKMNKILLVLVVIILVGIGLIFYGLIRYFYLGNGQDNYGNRLNDIEKYPITKKDKESITALYSEVSSVGDVKVEIQGKIIYITIDFTENIKLDDAKSLAVKTLEVLSDEIKSYYDIQYILTADSLKENTLFPTMGYKNKTNSQISWIKS